MTGINKDIYDSIIDLNNQNRLSGYGLSITDVQIFLESSTVEERSRQAKLLFRQVIHSLHNDAMEKYYDQLVKYENALHFIFDYHRDHSVHIILCYLLGICINERILANDSKHVSTVQWIIACLFHDIGYPLQLIYDSLVAMRDEYGWSPDLQLTPKRNKIFDKKGPIGLLTDYYKRWNLHFRSRTEYQFAADEKRICHGMISAFTVLEQLATIYNSLGYDDDYYRINVVPSCAAIFLHNLHPLRYKGNKLTGNHGSQVALLLKIVDEFQDWWRPSAKYPDGYDASKYRLQLTSNTCNFIVTDADRFLKISHIYEQCINYSPISVLSK